MEKCREAFAKHDITRLAVIHGNRDDDALQWKEMLLEMHPYLRVDIVPITSTLSVHAGEGTLAVMWYNAHLLG
jgi:fatty acid-binding protein DegV